MPKKRGCSIPAVNAGLAETLDDIDVSGGSVISKTYSTEELADLKNRGLSLSEVGKIAGISKQAVGQRLKNHSIAVARTEAFKRNEPNILYDKRRMILESISDADVAAMKGKLRDKAVAYAVLVDKERLITGQSTANIQCWTAIVQAAQRLEKDVTPPAEVTE